MQASHTSSIEYIRIFVKRNTIIIILKKRHLWSPLAWLLPAAAALVTVAFAVKRHHYVGLAFAHLPLALLWSLPWFITQPAFALSLGSGSEVFDGRSRCVCVYLCSCVCWWEGGRRSVVARGGVVGMYAMYTMCGGALLFAVDCSFCHSMFPQP